MSLQITKNLPNGTTATYFKIHDIVVDFVNKKGTVNVYGYINRAARDANPEAALIGKVFVIPLSDVTIDPRPEAYVELKSAITIGLPTAYFEGATDC